MLVSTIFDRSFNGIVDVLSTGGAWASPLRCLPEAPAPLHRRRHEPVEGVVEEVVVADADAHRAVLKNRALQLESDADGVRTLRAENRAALVVLDAHRVPR